MPAGKYVAVYQEYAERGVVIEGNGTIPFMPVPCPVPRPFDFDGSKGFAEQYSQLSGDFLIFYGTYYSNYSPASCYTRATYNGIYKYPYTLESGVTILGIDSAGTINATFEGKPIVLKVGDRWVSPVTVMLKDEMFQIEVDGKYLNSGVFRPFIVQYDSSWAVENKGMFDRSNLKTG